jgi:hypothetical protein
MIKKIWFFEKGSCRGSSFGSEVKLPLSMFEDLLREFPTKDDLEDYDYDYENLPILANAPDGLCYNLSEMCGGYGDSYELPKIVKHLQAGKVVVTHCEESVIVLGKRKTEVTKAMLDALVNWL